MSIQRKLTVAYFWNICGKWGVRLVGIGSTLNIGSNAISGTTAISGEMLRLDCTY